MIKLLIVDDEKNTREGLRKTIPWIELGVGKVCEAKNGIEGLRVVDDVKPELILCDVRMPRMDGIKFSQKVKEKYPWCKIIFLSGFSDKEYLESAIKLGVVDYLEKPVRIADLKAVIQNTVKLINQDIEKQVREQALEQHLNQSKLLYKQQLALKLISQTTDFGLLPGENKEIYDFGRANTWYTAVAVIIGRRNGSVEISMDNTCNSIVLWLNSDENALKYGCLSLFVKDTVLAIILNKRLKQINDLQQELCEFFNEIINRFTDAGYDYSIGIGESVMQLKKLPLSYISALEAAEKQFFRGCGSIIFHSSCEGQEFILNEAFYTAFEVQLTENAREEAIKAVGKLAFDLKRSELTDQNYVKNIYIELNTMLESIYRKIVLDAGVADNMRSNGWLEVLGYSTLEEIEKWFDLRLKSFFDSLEEMESEDAKIYEIKNFIGKHYSNKDISLKMIADHVQLSPNYMCKVFKSKTGWTVNDYITHVRLEKAGVLLKNSRMKIYEVADATGFENPNYFAKLFKNFYGKTPSEYKEKLKL